MTDAQKFNPSTGKNVYLKLVTKAKPYHAEVLSDQIDI